MPSNIAAPCQTLPEIANAQAQTLLLWAGDAIFAYQECAARHQAAVNLYQQLTD
nr:MAG TPA: hypothetical protein [Bacteriophage sp.]